MLSLNMIVVCDYVSRYSFSKIFANVFLVGKK